VNNSILEIIIVIVCIAVLKIINNFIYLKYKDSKYKAVTYTLPYIGGSLTVFAILYFSDSFFNSENIF